MTARLAALVAPLALLASPGIAMTDDMRALSLDVREQDGSIEVTLTGAAREARKVAYTLEVTGSSNSRHRGSTTLAAETPAVLSTITVSAAEGWCVRLKAEEAGLEPYEVVRGSSCAAD